MSEQTEVLNEEPKKELTDFLGDLPGAPTKEQIEKWKAIYGEVFGTGFSETEIYLFRPLRRSEHRELQLLLNDPEKQIDQLKYEEMVCDKCVLYPEKNDWEACAGAASTLSEQIFQNSRFLSPQAASMIVVKL